MMSMVNFCKISDETTVKMDRRMSENNSVEDDKTTALQLMAIKGNAKRASFDPKRDRFNMPHSADTRIHKDLNANRMVINNSNIAIATQYPLPHQLEAQFQMLIENRTPALVILASISDMRKNQLPDYFSMSATYGQVTTRSIAMGNVELGDGIKAQMFKLEVAGFGTSIDMPVIHVHNWPDHQTVSPKATSNLVTLIELTLSEKRAFYEKRKSRAVLDPERILPVIHCRAGVGRTGQAIAAMVMKKNPELSLASITNDLRVSRNNYMIQTPVQMETLVKLEKGKQSN